MQFDFSGKNVVITGGSRGIGLSAAILFASLGAKVSICAVNSSSLESALTELKKRGFSAYGQICNVADRSQLFGFADASEQFFAGLIDVWVSNAGVYSSKKLIETSEEDWARIVDVNMKSVYLGGLVAFHKMAENGGVLINAASFASHLPSVGSGPYGASKAAVVNMTKVLAAELAPFGIRVCAYSPGDVATDMMTSAIEERGPQLLKAIAAQSFGKPEDVAYAIVFLASDYASYLTGACIDITGGKFCVQNPAAAWPAP